MLSQLLQEKDKINEQLNKTYCEYILNTIMDHIGE
jgi:hypothetical protein